MPATRDSRAKQLRDRYLCQFTARKARESNSKLNCDLLQQRLVGLRNLSDAGWKRLMWRKTESANKRNLSVTGNYHCPPMCKSLLFLLFSIYFSFLSIVLWQPVVRCISLCISVHRHWEFEIKLKFTHNSGDLALEMRFNENWGELETIKSVRYVAGKKMTLKL